MAARINSGSRGGKVLIYRGFKYQKNRERGEIKHWRCWNEECRAPLKTNTFDLEDENARIIVQNEPQHTHAEEDTIIEKSEIKRKLVEIVKQDQSVPIKIVYNTVMRTH